MKLTRSSFEHAHNNFCCCPCFWCTFVCLCHSWKALIRRYKAAPAAFSFGQPATAPASQPALSFGSAAPSTTSSGTGFSFGSAAAKPFGSAPASTGSSLFGGPLGAAPAAAPPAFSFAQKPAESSSVNSAGNSFAFGSGSANTSSSGSLFGATSSATPSLFGAPSTASTTPAAPLFGGAPFGQKAAEAPKAAFSFTKPAETTAAEPAKPLFAGFGAPFAPASPSPFSLNANAKKDEAPKSSPFTFAASIPPAAEQPKAPAFNFGAPGTAAPLTPAASPSNSAPSTPQAEPPKFSFGAPAATTSAAPPSLPAFNVPNAAKKPSPLAQSPLFPATPDLTKKADAKAAEATPTPSLFSFGKPAEQPKAAEAPAAPASTSLFSFGKPAEAKPADPLAPPAPTSGPAFGFGKPADAAKPASLSSIAPVAATPQPSLVPAANAPNPLSGMKLEDIVNKWNNELDERTKEFVALAGEVKAWDAVLISNGDKVSVGGSSRSNLTKILVQSHRLQNCTVHYKALNRSSKRFLVR